MAPSHRIFAPLADARDDYEIFSKLAEKLGIEASFTEGLTGEEWLRHMYEQLKGRLDNTQPLPSFDEFWQGDLVSVTAHQRVEHTLLADFRLSPDKHPLSTPSGKIELFSETIAGFGYDDCPPHPAWLEPKEWLGAAEAETYPLHMISNQPYTKLHSQYDNAAVSLGSKINGREPVRMNPADAEARGLQQHDIVRVFNDRGACLAGVLISEHIRPGVIQLSTGAWYDPLEPGVPGTLDKHGNPNVLTYDAGTSTLSQGPSAQTCLAQVQKYEGDLPRITCFEAPQMVSRQH